MNAPQGVISVVGQYSGSAKGSIYYTKLEVIMRVLATSQKS